MFDKSGEEPFGYGVNEMRNPREGKPKVHSQLLSTNFPYVLNLSNGFLDTWVKMLLLPLTRTSVRSMI
jgi:hypothetical protein